MADEKRISVSFGAFAVDIEGYDDPFAVLSTLITHIKTASDKPLGEQAFGAADLENADLLASLSLSAARLEIKEDAGQSRLVVNAPDAKQDEDVQTASPAPEAAAPEDDVLEDDAPEAAQAAPEIKAASAATPPQPDVTDEPAPEQPTERQVEDDAGAAPETADDTPVEAAKDDEAEVETPQEDEAEVEAAQDDEAPSDEPAAGDEPIAAAETAKDPDPITDEETAILRRVRYAITHASDADGAAQAKPKAKPKPASPRSPAEQKAEVVKDIASTLRRIGARTDGPDDQTGGAPTNDKPASAPASAAAKTAGDGAAKKRKPLTMQMQIRPKTPVQPKEDAPRKAAKAAAPPKTKPAGPRITAGKPAAPKIVPPTGHDAVAEGAPQAVDREKMRERLVKLEQDDEIIDNFLFDDVDPTVTVEAVAPAKEETAKPETPAKASTDTEEPLLLTPAEAAPLILDNPVQEPLVLTNPIKPAATSSAPAPAPTEPVARIVEDTAPPKAAAPRKNAPPAPEPQAPSTPAKGKRSTEPGFARLEEARDAPIPVLIEESTRPKQRNGGPRLFALSDETRFDKSMSPQDFAAHVGATSLHDMMEATAVYMAMVEGRVNFSRKDVMNAFARIEAADAYSTEQRLKTFRKLQSSGALTRVDEHEYALSHETRFGYETQLSA